MAFRKSTSVAEKPAEARNDEQKSEHETRDVKRFGATSERDDGLPVITSLNLIFFRMVWCFAGPAFLALLTVRNATTRDGWTTPSDMVFLLGLLGTVAARWIGYRAGERANTLGEVTTTEQLHRYTILWLAGGVFVWVIANAIGNGISS